MRRIASVYLSALAELSNAFTCAHLEIANGPRPDHVHYLAHWLRRTGRNPADIFTVASKAHGS